MKKRNISHHHSVSFPAFIMRISFCFFLILIFTMVLMAVSCFFFYKIGVFDSGGPYSFILPMLEMGVISIVLGTIISYIAVSKVMGPLRDFVQALQRIAQGDYTTRLSTAHHSGAMFDLYDNFNTMAKELQSVEILSTDFMSNVSHEFKTPISAISGYATLLQDDTLTEAERQDYVEMILQSTAGLSSLTNDIMDLSRLESGKVLLSRETYSLDEQIREVLLQLESQWTKKNLSLTIEMDPISYYGSRELISHVWQNLLVNAIKYNHENGNISIFASRGESGITVKISDTGIGMDEQTCHHAFDKFYQGETSRSSKGYGLGLSLVKRILDLTGGRIQAKSTPGNGSTFTVFLMENASHESN